MGMASHDIDFLHCLFGARRRCVPTSDLAAATSADRSVLEVDADDVGAGVADGERAPGHPGDERRRAREQPPGWSCSAATARPIDGSIMGGELDTRVRAVHIDRDGELAVAASTRMPRSSVERLERRAAGAIRSLALMLEDWLPAFDGEPAPKSTWRRLAGAARGRRHRHSLRRRWVDLDRGGEVAPGISRRPGHRRQQGRRSVVAGLARRGLRVAGCARVADAAGTLNDEEIGAHFSLDVDDDASVSRRCGRSARLDGRRGGEQRRSSSNGAVTPERCAPTRFAFETNVFGAIRYPRHATALRRSPAPHRQRLQQARSLGLATTDGGGTRRNHCSATTCPKPR